MSTNSEPKKSPMKWIAFVGFALACGVVGRWLGYMSGKQAPQSVDSINSDASRKKITAILKTMSENINKTTPIIVDKSTQLDTTYVYNDTLVYSFSTPHTSSKQIDVSKFTNIMRSSLINGYKTNPDLQSARDCNVTVIYKYRDKDGIYFSTISISPKDF